MGIDFVVGYLQGCGEASIAFKQRKSLDPCHYRFQRSDPSFPQESLLSPKVYHSY